MLQRYAGAWEPSRWFAYSAGGKRAYCQVDGLLHSENRIVLCEVKYQHCADSYFQLHNLYLPVVRAIYPEREIALCEVVRWYDPACLFPCGITLLDDLLRARPGGFFVHILNR